MVKTITAYQSNRGNLFATEAEAKADDARGDLLDAFNRMESEVSPLSLGVHLLEVTKGEKTDGPVYEFLRAAHDFIASQPVEPQTELLSARKQPISQPACALDAAKEGCWAWAADCLRETFNANTDYSIEAREKHPVGGMAFVLGGEDGSCFFTVYSSGKATTGGKSARMRADARALLQAEGFTVKA